MVAMFICSLIFIALYGVIFALSFCFFSNNEAKIYSDKSKHGTFTQIMSFALLIMFFVLIGVLAIVAYKKNHTWENLGSIIATWITIFIGLCHLLVFIIVVSKTNKRKLKIENFANEDFDKILNNYTKPSEEYLNTFFIKNARYKSLVDTEATKISEMVDDEKMSFEFIFSSIIVFNNFVTCKGTKNRNYYAFEKSISLLKKLQQRKK